MKNYVSVGGSESDFTTRWVVVASSVTSGKINENLLIPAHCRF